MGENPKIEWCRHTFNPWIGCTKVSAGCAHCYAEELMDRRYGTAKWGDDGTRVRTSPGNWRKPLAWDRAAKKAGERHRVFCASLADVFEDRDELRPWRAELFELIANTPHLDWLLLTKRPENIVRLWPGVSMAVLWETPEGHNVFHNVWLGTSVEDHRVVDRVDHLRDIPARVRFLSVEPLIGSLDGLNLDGIDWVIVGGESGAHKRPVPLDVARGIRDTCAREGIPFFFKQVDKVQPIPDDLMIRQFPQD